MRRALTSRSRAGFTESQRIDDGGLNGSLVLRWCRSAARYRGARGRHWLVWAASTNCCRQFLGCGGTSKDRLLLVARVIGCWAKLVPGPDPWTQDACVLPPPSTYTKLDTKKLGGWLMHVRQGQGTRGQASGPVDSRARWLAFGVWRGYIGAFANLLSVWEQAKRCRASGRLAGVVVYNVGGLHWTGLDADHLNELDVRAGMQLSLMLLRVKHPLPDTYHDKGSAHVFRTWPAGMQLRRDPWCCLRCSRHDPMGG